MSLCDKHNYRSFTKSAPASFLLHCIENILNHSSGKCRDSLTMAALSSPNQPVFGQYLFTDTSLATA